MIYYFTYSYFKDSFHQFSIIINQKYCCYCYYYYCCYCCFMPCFGCFKKHFLREVQVRYQKYQTYHLTQKKDLFEVIITFIITQDYNYYFKVLPCPLVNNFVIKVFHNYYYYCYSISFIIDIDYSNCNYCSFGNFKNSCFDFNLIPFPYSYFSYCSCSTINFHIGFIIVNYYSNYYCCIIVIINYIINFSYCNSCHPFINYYSPSIHYYLKVKD